MSCTFQNEKWTMAKQPTHQVIAARGKHHEVVGYFYAHEASEIAIAMDVFDIEYGNKFDRIIAVKNTKHIERTNPNQWGAVIVARDILPLAV